MKKNFTYSMFLPYLLSTVILFSGVLGFFYLQNNLLEESAEEFEGQMQEVLGLISYRLNRDEYMLYGIRGLFSASKSVERQEFNVYNDAVDFKKNYPGILAMNYREKVLAEDKDKFVSSVVSDTSLEPGGYPDFKIYPETTNEELIVTKYVYPEKENIEALGYNPYSDVKRKLSLEKARDENTTIVTPKINLVQNGVPGFNMIMPIYQNEKSVDTISERRENLVGFVTASFAAERFFDSIIQERGLDNRNFSFKIYDSPSFTEINIGSLLFDFSNPKIVSAEDSIVKSKTLSIPGRTWTLVFYSPLGYGLGTINKIFPWAVLFSTIVGSILIFLLINVLINSRRRALTLAETMTKELRESEEKFRVITEEAKDAIVVADDKGKIVFWNKGAENMLGYSRQEALEKNLHSFITVNKEHQKMDNVLNFGQTGESFVLGKSWELPVKKKDGTILQVDLTVARAKLDDRWHAVGIMRDITERKKEEEIEKEHAEELERMNRIMIGRESKMIELKEEISRLREKNKDDY